LRQAGHASSIHCRVHTLVLTSAPFTCKASSRGHDEASSIPGSAPRFTLQHGGSSVSTQDASPRFQRFRDKDGTWVSGCLLCFTIVGSAKSEEELAMLEKLHQCFEKR